MKLCFAVLGVLLSLACGGGSEDSVDARPTHPDAADPGNSDAGTSSVAVTIPFMPRVGGEPFACGGTYDVGTAPSPYTVKDFRLYVHDVRLLRDGDEVPLVLDANDWQGQGVALLDFEDKTDACAESGTTGTNTVITGTVPEGDYVGLRFVLGVPEALNHADPAAANPPLDVSSMFWIWRSGYKFLRLDGDSSGDAFLVHLGSTGCSGSVPAAPPSAPCTAGNRVEIKIDDFVHGTDSVVADIAGLFALSDVGSNAAGSAPGCMSDADDADCAPIFTSLGMGDGTQTFFVRE